MSRTLDESPKKFTGFYDVLFLISGLQILLFVHFAINQSQILILRTVSAQRIDINLRKEGLGVPHADQIYDAVIASDNCNNYSWFPNISCLQGLNLNSIPTILLCYYISFYSSSIFMILGSMFPFYNIVIFFIFFLSYNIPFPTSFQLFWLIEILYRSKTVPIFFL